MWNDIQNFDLQEVLNGLLEDLLAKVEAFVNGFLGDIFGGLSGD